MTGIDPVIHPPARLQILTALSGVSEAEFVTLRELLQISDSMLSKHLSQLADCAYVQTRKSSRSGRRTTWVFLTRTGERALREHIAALRSIIDAVDVAEP